MAEFEIGQPVRIRCDVQPGPFDDENLITLETIDGPVSGFVSTASIEDKKENTGYIRGTLVAISNDTVTVRLSGSFFTTNGLADFPRDQALAA